MNVKIIKSEKELNAALARVKKLMELNPAKNSKEAEEIKLLGLAIKDYEDVHYPTPPSDSIEAIKFMIEQNDLRK
jgi:HTH-type transcriptional regulator/antitoxin HigA